MLDVPHHLCGGILHGKFPVYYNASGWELIATQASLSYPRALRHIINQAGKGFHPVAEPPSQPQSELLRRRPWQHEPSSPTLDWNGLLSVTALFVPVLCPSVFTTTKWTRRALTPDELAAAFDLSSEGLRFYAKWPFGQRRRLPFLASMPSRILLRIWHSLRPVMSFPRGVVLGTAATGELPREVLVLKEEERNTKVVQEQEKDEQSNGEQANQLGDTSKATKADKAPVPVFLWDERIWSKGLHSEAKRSQYVVRYGHCPLSSWRSCLLRRWRRNITTSFLSYMRDTHGMRWWALSSEERSKDMAAGADCIVRASQCTWWEWTCGSWIFFWRWPERWQKDLRDGFQVWMSGDPPAYFRPQRGVPDPVKRGQVTEKLTDVRQKGYIAKGNVKSLTGFFPVDKGPTDIRMVYDASKSGLNASLFAPSFGLPSADSASRCMDENTWMADVDLGEMFLNFILHESLRQYCGVDLKPFFRDECGKNKTLWEVWTRCMMGLKNSPYGCVKGALLAFEIIRGNRCSEGNPYHYARVELNLPGAEGYDPTKPWIAKIRMDGKLANETVVYVDDLRSMGFSEEECWRVVHVTGCILTYLGLQVAFRKTRPPSQIGAGAWAGTVFGSGSEGVTVSVTQEKWEKAKNHLAAMSSVLEAGEEFQYKELESIRGFFVHLCRTYETMTPFIKGLHLTLDGWRPGRDTQGWRIKEDKIWDAEGQDLVPLASGHPATVKGVPRLSSDIEALSELLSHPTPTKQLVRAKRISVVVYGFGDASGAGFGSTFAMEKDLWYRHGVWGKDAEGMSSNYRELRNLVEALEASVLENNFANSEVFLFTDNTTAEGAYWKGNTPSPVLFELIVRLHKLEMSGDLRLHVIHVAGTRMIRQGTDALSRGCLTEGVMSGMSMTGFVPLNESGPERSPDVVKWIRDWTEVESLTPLEPMGWFAEGHGIEGGRIDRAGLWQPVETAKEWFLWAPPPAIADVALEELTTSRHKRTWLNHVFVCPRLMTYKWRKKLNKLADVVFEVPAGSTPFWPASMHEPLIVGILLRFVSLSPWQLRRHPRVLELGGTLSRVWKTEGGSGRPVLRELCLLPGLLERV